VDLSNRVCWTFNMPLDLRPALEACFPDARFHFVTTRQPAWNSARRITAAANSIIATFGEEAPADLQDFLGKTGNQSCRIWASFMRVHGRGYPASGACGFVVGREGPAAAPDRTALLQTGMPTPPEAKGLLDLYKRLGIGAINVPAALPASAPAMGSGRRLLLIPDETASAAELLAAVSTSRPDATPVLLLQTSGGRASGGVPPQGVEVFSAVYRPNLLDAFDGVATGAHFAGFDALLRGLDVLCLGTPGWHLALPNQASPQASLEDVFAAYFLAGTHYQQPGKSGRTTAEDAFRAVAKLLPNTSSPVTPSAPSPAAAPPAPQLAAVKAALPKAAPSPDRTPRSAPTPAPATPSAVVAPPQPPAAAPTAPRTRILNFDLPAELASGSLLTRFSGGPRGGEVIALGHDMLRSPLAAPLFLHGGAFAADALLAQREPRAAALSALARERPEIVQRMLVAELAALPPTARVALLVGLDDPLIRLFGRACATVPGLMRVHVPALPWHDQGPFAAVTAACTSNLASLVDVVGVWSPSHHRHAAQIGYPADRLFHVTPGLQSDSKDGLLLCLHQGGAHAATLLSAAAAEARRRGVRLCLQASSDALAMLPSAASERVLAEEHVAFEWAEAPSKPALRILAGATAVICDTVAMHGIAAAAARPSLCVLDSDVGEASGFVGAASANALELALAGLEARQGTETAASDELALLLRFILARSLPLTPIPGAAERILQRGSLPVDVLEAVEQTGDQARSQLHVGIMLGVRHRKAASSGPDRLVRSIDTDAFMVWGARDHGPNREVRTAARLLGRDLLLVEDGFVRSIGLGLSGEPGLSVVIDDRAAYFDATVCSRMEATLNAPSVLGAGDLTRVQAVIRQITELKISKYNAAPYVRATIGNPGRPKILLVDQRSGDESLLRGLADPETFDAMIEAAAGFAQTHDIIVKLHPDVTGAGRSGCISTAALQRLGGQAQTWLVEEEVNIFTLLDLSEKVFVATSGVGFEALMAQREVWCFGMPYFAGRGLTKDLVQPLRPRRACTVEEIFQTAWIALSRYAVPTRDQACQIEEVIDHVVAARPWKLPAPDAATVGLGKKISVS
jgi:hypothetical protein